MISDDYVVVTAGRAYVHAVQAHTNGTHVITVKNAPGSGFGCVTSGVADLRDRAAALRLVAFYATAYPAVTEAVSP